MKYALTLFLLSALAGAQVSSGGAHAEQPSLRTIEATANSMTRRGTHTTVTASQSGPLEILHWSAASADAAQTCYFLHHGGHEDFLPTQHCLPAAGMILGQTAAEEFIAHKLQRHHPGWAKVVRLYGISDSLFAIAYSKAHGAW